MEAAAQLGIPVVEIEWLYSCIREWRYIPVLEWDLVSGASKSKQEKPSHVISVTLEEKKNEENIISSTGVIYDPRCCLV